MVARTVRDRKAASSNLATPTTRKDLQARSARRRKNVRREELMGGHFCVCVKCIAFEEPTQWHLGGNTQIPEKAARDMRLSLCQRGEIKLSRDAPLSSAITRARGVGAIVMLCLGQSFLSAPFWGFNAAHRCPVLFLLCGTALA